MLIWALPFTPQPCPRNLILFEADCGVIVTERICVPSVFCGIVSSRGMMAVMSALAQPKPSEPRLAERFELYVCGVELANGCAELTNAGEQRRRLTAQMAEKARLYNERYPIDEDFIAALRHMPPACGVALGLDRLVMLATGAPHIEQVLWSAVPDA